QAIAPARARHRRAPSLRLARMLGEAGTARWSRARHRRAPSLRPTHAAGHVPLLELALAIGERLHCGREGWPPPTHRGTHNPSRSPSASAFIAAEVVGPHDLTLRDNSRSPSASAFIAAVAVLPP